MKYHVFPNILQFDHLVNGDVCMYCSLKCGYIYTLLNKSDQFGYQAVSNSRNEATKFLSERISCINGITEDEFIIKNLLE